MVVSSLCTIWLGLSLAPACVSTPSAPDASAPHAASCEGPCEDSMREPCGVSRAFLHDHAGAADLSGRRFAAREEARSDAAARFGADAAAPATIVVDVPGLFPYEASPRRFEIDPFTPVTVDRGDNHWSDPYRRAHEKLAANVEAARQAWLKDHNFTGGVRTFSNAKSPEKSSPAGEAKRSAATKIEPRAVMELPPDMPRVRAKLQVLAPGQSPARGAKVVTRVLPKEQPSTKVAAAEPQEAKTGS
jgi:hypothetical protein